MPLRRTALALALAAAPLALAPAAAQALSVTLVVTGTVSASDTAAITVGDAASLTLTYDSAAPDIQISPTSGAYTTATLSAVGRFGDFVFAVGGPGRFDLVNDIGITNPDQFRWLSQAPAQSAPAGIADVQLRLDLFGNLLTSDALPTSDLAFARLDLLESRFEANGLVSGGISVVATIDTLSIGPTQSPPPPGAAVPVPAAGLLLGTAVVGLGLGRRRRRARG